MHAKHELLSGGTQMATIKIVEVSDLAAEKFRDLLKEQGEEDGMLRVMVTPGPDGGMQYMLSVEKEAGEDDFIIDADRIRVLVDADSAPLIDGSQIDYAEGLMRSGFVISNPNFQAGGCGGGGGGGCGSGGGGGGCGCGGH
jgi:iron-sulfur cluster assembly protein